MKTQKPIFKIIQVWTLFIFTTLSFLWFISFSRPEISSFLSIEDWKVKIINKTFADDDEDEWDDEDEDDEEYNYYKRSDDNDEREEEEDDDYYYNKEKNYNNTNNSTSQNQNVTNTKSSNTLNDTITTNTNTWKNCKEVTETVYDTVTSASWTKTQKPRLVTKEVCETINKPIDTKIDENITQTWVVLNENITKTEIINSIETAWLTDIEKEGLKYKLTNILKPLDNDKKIRKIDTIVSKINISILKLEKQKINSDEYEAYLLDYKILIYKEVIDTISLVKDEILTEKTLTSMTSLDINMSPEIYKAVNWKTYTIISENWIVFIKKPDWSYAKNTFLTFEEAKNYLDNNNLPEPESYKAKNWKTYIILFQDGVVVIKKSDGSYAKSSFLSYDEAKNYLDVNAPKVIVNTTVAAKKPTTTKKVAKTTTTTTTTGSKLNANITTKVTKVNTNTWTIADTSTNTKTTKTTAKKSTPKVDTTTKAS